jgi:hypothetical protein
MIRASDLGIKYVQNNNRESTKSYYSKNISQLNLNTNCVLAHTPDVHIPTRGYGHL